jgi:hypothetical protein
MKPIIGWLIIMLFFSALIGGFSLVRKNTAGTPHFSLATTTLPDLDATPRGQSRVP